MSTMKTLIIRPADVSLNPLGASSSVADARVSVVYDRDVWVGGQPVPRVPLIETSIPTDGLMVPVIASDDPSITDGAGFVIKVIVETSPRLGQHNDAGTSLARTIQVVAADPDVVPLGSKPNLTAVLDPAQYADVMSAITAAVETKAAAAQVKASADGAAADAAAAKSDAAAAVSKVNQAVASQDSATAQNVTSGDLTRRALATAEPRDVNLHLLGVTPESGDVRPAIQAAIDAAPDGARLLLPSTPGASHHISGSIKLRPGMTFSGLGGQATIVQDVWGAPIVDAERGSVTVSYIHGSSSQTKSAVSGTFRDGSATNAATLVWAGGSGATTRLSHLTGVGLMSVARITPWDAASGSAHDYVTVLADDLLSLGCDWGIVGRGWADSDVTRTRGTYALRSGSTDPSHLVYVADGLPNRDVRISGVAAWDSTGGSVVQCKSVAGLTLTDIAARNCTGLLSLRDVQDTSMNALRSRGDVSPADPVIYIQGAGTEANISARGVRLDVTTQVAAMRIDGSDGVYDDVLITEKRTAQSDSYSVPVYGQRNRLNRFRIINSGSAAWRGIGLSVGSGHVVRSPSIVATRVGVTIHSGATGCVVDYDPAEISRHSTSGSRSVQAVDTSTLVRSRTQIQAITMASSQMVQIRTDEYDTAAVNVTDTTGFTVTTPIEPANGRVITYRFTNNSGGTMGNVSWASSGAGHTLNGAWTNPGAGQTKTISFQYDSGVGKWLEIGRSA